MLKRRLYYKLKPFLPWRLRVAVRQAAAKQKLKSVADVWPIDPAAADAPEGWPGWPDGKKFAFVLTHDVEGVGGVAKSRQLAEFEMAQGVRSCFNFIPEGTYTVAPELRRWLTANGFEVGIHDLHHDGELYSSRAVFRQKAARINQYVHSWSAAGFRSGFMLHETDWVHDLDVAYDCSTFDTDPFEPQPDAAGTIFPYWIPAPADRPERPGYVELPYSLPQDSTLFLILREATPEIWLRKLDWIVAQGGMALVNIHPDYVQFEGQAAFPWTFPVSHYRELLNYVQSRYAGQYWQPTPGQLAAWYKSHRRPAAAVAAAPVVSAPQSLRGKRAAVLLYSYYPSDSRPRRAASAMIEAGMEVDLFCLSEQETEPRSAVVDGVRVFRFPMRHSRQSKFSYLWNYSAFLTLSFFALLRRGWRRRYDVVHVHNMPDALVFATILAKLRGARILLDLHDPMPELMMSIYGQKESQWQIRLLKTLERWSIGLADVVFTPNLTFRNLFAARNPRPEKINIVMNSPEEGVFDPANFADQAAPQRKAGEFRIMHHGSIVHRHGIDLLVEALAVVRPRLPGVQLDIYGRREPFLDEVLALARQRGVADIVSYHGNKSAREIGRAICATDLGVIPNRRSAFTELNFPTRIFEYLAMNRLVVAPATRGITDYFGPEDLPLYEQNNIEALAERILWVREQPSAARAMLERGRRIYREHLWSGEEARFLALVDRPQLS